MKSESNHLLEINWLIERVFLLRWKVLCRSGDKLTDGSCLPARKVVQSEVRCLFEFQKGSDNRSACRDGEYRGLLERYKNRSLVIGRDVVLCSEGSEREAETIAEGKVVALGDDLELFLDSRAEPIHRGRVMLCSV